MIIPSATGEQGLAATWDRMWPPVLALFVFAVALWAQAHALVGVFYDDGQYVVLARALAEGEGFRSIHLPDAPPGVHYPFLYPFVLSLLWRLWPVFPSNVVLFQLFDAAALAAASLAIALHARRWGVPAAVQYVVLPLAFAAFPLLTIVGVRFSEPMFLALVAASLLCVDGREEESIGRAALAGVLVGLAGLTRSIAVTALGGIAVSLWMRGRRRAALTTAGVGAAIMVPWFVWTAIHHRAIDPRLGPNYATYADVLGDTGWWGVLQALEPSVVAPVARLVLPPLPGFLWYPLALVLMGLMVWGAVRVFPRVSALIVSLALYLVVVAVWPFAPDRFVWILVPWLFLLAAVGALDVWRRGRVGRAVVIVLVVAAMVGYGRVEARSLAGRRFARAAEAISGPFRLLAPALAQAVPERAVVAGEDEALLYLYTGRKSVPSYLFRLEGRDRVAYDARASLDFFCDYGVTHVVTAGGETAAAPMLRDLGRITPAVLDTVFSVTDGPQVFALRCGPT